MRQEYPKMTPQQVIDAIDLQRRALLDMYRHGEVTLSYLYVDDVKIPYLKSLPEHRLPATDEVKQYIRRRCGAKALRVWWNGEPRRGGIGED